MAEQLTVPELEPNNWWPLLRNRGVGKIFRLAWLNSFSTQLPMILRTEKAGSKQTGGFRAVCRRIANLKDTPLVG